MINTPLQSHTHRHFIDHKKQVNIDEANLKSSLMQKNINNIKYFLSAYRESANFGLLSKEFTKDTNVFSQQSQIPDCWTKTRIPFNRNLIFHLNVLENNRSFNKRKQKKEVFKRKQIHLAPNYYPKVPFVLDANCPLVSSMIKLDLKPNEPKNVEMVFAGLTKKSWLVTYCHLNEVLNYGPMDSMKVYYFLKNVYNGMKPADKEKKSIMIVDTKYDVHYQPETLFQFLEEEYNHQAKEGDYEENLMKEMKKAFLDKKTEKNTQSEEGLRLDSKEVSSAKQDVNSEEATTYSSLNNKEEEIEFAEVN